MTDESEKVYDYEIMRGKRKGLNNNEKGSMGLSYYGSTE